MASAFFLRSLSPVITVLDIQVKNNIYALTTLREESVSGRKKLRNLLLRSGPQKIAESWNLLLRFGQISGKLRNLLLRWTNKWEIKEFITAMEYLR